MNRDSQWAGLACQATQTGLFGPKTAKTSLAHIEVVQGERSNLGFAFVNCELTWIGPYKPTSA